MKKKFIATRHFKRSLLKFLYFVKGINDICYNISFKSTEKKTTLIVGRLIISWVHKINTNLSLRLYIQGLVINLQYFLHCVMNFQ